MRVIAHIANSHLLTHRMVAGLLATRKAELAIDDPVRLRDPRLVDETCTMVRRYLGVADG